ncbi:MAG: [protein-PII] uridylyltransferase [Deltaproteobacteria bacterium]|nr:[protein-PII] uridylyltransferase [Deltaproteobacteria bacterium]MDL1986540.1 [protein-PII] uridylyltransferase [Deltaproteobacteria bacterium]
MSQSKDIKVRHESASEKLQKKKKHLISDFISGKERSFMKRHSRILNDYFMEKFESSIVDPEIIDKNPYAIIALGGYGREEQCIHSDVDLLFLFEKNVPDEADDIIQEIVYPLWDIGLEVGHSTRSLKECVSLSGEDFVVLNSVLDARFICGMSVLYSELMRQIREKVIRDKSDEIIKWLVQSGIKRHGRFGDSAYLLEPNIKEGQGGLRDYHTMLWIARIKYNIKQPRDLEYYGLLSHSEFRILKEALLFIWNVRNRLHYIAGRKCDQLHFEYQTELANALNLRKQNGLQPVERFLAKLHSRMEVLKQQYLMFIGEQAYTKKSKPSKKLNTQTQINGLEVKRGMLNFVSPEAILDSPDLLIKIFEESARLQVPLRSEAKRLLKEFIYLIDDDFRNSSFALKSFERILFAPSTIIDVLNDMLSTGFLVQFIPEFKSIINRIQFDEYHLYPVARHSLLTVQTIKKFGTPEDKTEDKLYGNLYEELSNKRLLLWAALLHDIGKGDPGAGHSQIGAKIVNDVLKKRGFKKSDIETITFLINEHLFLIKTASRRDLNDEGTAITCARKIKDIERLIMLYLLTVSDSISTGPKAWNEWTSALLRNLFLTVLNILKKGELATGEAVETVNKKKEEILLSASSLQEKQKLEQFFEVMSPRYLLYASAQDILEHIRLYKELGNTDFVWKVTRTLDSNTRVVTICAIDRPGLFSKISGVFTLNSIDILDTQAYTWRNNIALDIFKVKPPLDQIFETERWDKAEANLKSALAGELNLTEALKEKMSAYQSLRPRASKRPNRIVIDNEGSSFFTIIEVFANDFPGLLFSITDALFRCGLDVWVSKISTKVDQVVDVFYVRDFDGQKVDAPDRVLAIKKVLSDVLQATGT